MLELNEATAMCAELQDQIKALKRDVADRVALLQRLEIQQQECEQKLQHIHKERMDNNDIMLRLHKEILEQNSKQDRAQRELKLARRTARTKVADAEYFGAFERQLKVRELEAGNTASLQRLAAMADETAGMTPYLTKLLYERGLNVPPACSTSSATGNVFDGDGRVQKSVSSRSLVGSIRGGSDAALSIGSDESPSSRSSIRGSSKGLDGDNREELYSNQSVFFSVFVPLVRRLHGGHVGSTDFGWWLRWFDGCRTGGYNTRFSDTAESVAFDNNTVDCWHCGWHETAFEVRNEASQLASHWCHDYRIN